MSSPQRLAEFVGQEADAVGNGRLAVIAPAGQLAGLTRCWPGWYPDLAAGEQPDLDQRAVRLAVCQAKGQGHQVKEFGLMSRAVPG